MKVTLYFSFFKIRFERSDSNLNSRKLFHLTCYRKLEKLPGDLSKHVLQLLDEAEPFRSRAEDLADLLHHLHRPRHVIAIFLTHLEMRPYTTELI